MNGAPRLMLEGNRLRVSGDITPDNVLAIRKEGEKLLASGEYEVKKELIVDVSELGAAHSVVLSLLLCWFRQASANNLSMRLDGVGGRLLSLASLCGLNNQLPGLDSGSSNA